MRLKTCAGIGQTLKGEKLYIRHMKLRLGPQEMYLKRRFLKLGSHCMFLMLLCSKLSKIKLGMERVKYSRI
jgi:hypothetical protein